jgi:hypothetical protein
MSYHKEYIKSKKEKEKEKDSEDEKLKIFLSEIFKDDVHKGMLSKSLDQTKKDNFEVQLLSEEKYKDSMVTLENQTFEYIKLQRIDMSDPDENKEKSKKQNVFKILETVRIENNISNYLYKHPISE